MRAFSIIFAALLPIFAYAATPGGFGGGSSGGMNFSCDVNLGVCDCKGVWDGADCKAMRKNCGKNKDDWHSCWGREGTKNPPACRCTMAKSGKTTPKPIPLPNTGVVAPTPRPAPNVYDHRTQVPRSAP